jgi:hypothetical protein
MNLNLRIHHFLAVSLLVLAGCGTPTTNNGTASNPLNGLSSPSPSPALPPSADVFSAQESEFTTLPSSEKLTENPYIRGKAVSYYKEIPYEKRSEKGAAPWKYDIFARGLPFAASPNEVETVVLRTCEESKGSDLTVEKGKPGERTMPAFKWKCEIVLVDRSIPAVIHKRQFENSYGQTVLVNADAKEFRPGWPSLEVQRFLESLPRQ